MQQDSPIPVQDDEQKQPPSNAIELDNVWVLAKKGIWNTKVQPLHNAS